MPGHRNRKDRSNKFRELEFADGETTQYGHVQGARGDRRFTLLCQDGTERIGCVRGKMRRREWIRQGDIVLCTRRDFQDDKLDVVHKFTEEEVRRLVQMGQIPAPVARAYSRGVSDIAAPEAEDGAGDSVEFEVDDI